MIHQLLGTEELNTTTKQLLMIRFLRSMAQGTMVVDLTLYLSALHWNGAAIGGVTTGSGLMGSAFILTVGILSDRLGRKPFILIYELMTLFCAILACFTTTAIFLIFAIVIAGFGRGRNGGAGPFAPAETAWLANHVKEANRGSVFSLNSAVGFIGMAVGSLLGGIPAWIGTAHPIVNYRPIFIVIAVLSLACVILIAITKDSQSEEEENGIPDKTETEPDLEEERSITKRENRLLLKLTLVNGLNGLGGGMAGPLISYWFHLKYGVDSAAIGTTLAIGFVLAGISSVLNGFLADKVGLVKSVTVMRGIGSAALLALPFMPAFSIASILYILRGAVNRGTIGNRKALSTRLTRNQRRGFAASIYSLSVRLPSTIGPTISGYLFDIGLLDLPFLLTAGLQLTSAGIYQRLFRQYDQRVNKEQTVSQ